MELTRDIYLRGTAWATAVQSLSDIFRTRTNYSLFMLSLSLGIMYDKRIKDPDMGEVEDHNPPSVPRNVLQNQANINGKLATAHCAFPPGCSTRKYRTWKNRSAPLCRGRHKDCPL